MTSTEQCFQRECVLHVIVDANDAARSRSDSRKSSKQIVLDNSKIEASFELESKLTISAKDGMLTLQLMVHMLMSKWNEMMTIVTVFAKS